MGFLTEPLHTELVGLRRDFHRHPEIAHEERRTAGLVADYLRALDLDSVRTEVGLTGVVAHLRGAADGPTVLLRADMDALPLVETDRGQPYRSTVEGMHHACGHDGHMAILLATAKLLVTRRADLRGSVVFLFQPAEERVGGAELMIADGALEQPRPDACFALHLWNDLPLGRVDAQGDAVFANADAFRIRLEGSGGHGAAPHQTADPIVAAAQLIGALQTLVSRETDPLKPSVLTIGSIHGGTAPNIIPSSVELEGTLRTFDDGLRERLLERIAALVDGLAGAFRLRGSLEPWSGCPAAVNDPRHAALVRRVAERLLGPEAVSARLRTTGADDMSLFLRQVPGCYFLVGSANAERGLNSPHHSPTFDFDERALEVGVELMAGVTLEYLQSGVPPDHLGADTDRAPGPRAAAVA